MLNYKKSLNVAVTGAVLSLFAVTGCHKAKTAPPPAPATAPTTTGTSPTATITADPMVIDPGQSVVLNWPSPSMASAT
jgi:peptidoglycan-associated lipoprotein